MIKNFFFKNSLLRLLVSFVFCMLLTSTIISGVILFILVRFDIMPILIDPVFLSAVGTLFIAGLVIGTLLTAILGNRSLRFIHSFITATESIAKGDFNTRIELIGPQEVKLVAQSFNAMAEELAAIETLQSDFVSNVSHEFKTPVVSIRGFAKLLKKDSLNETKRQEYLDIIILESARLSQLSGNILLLGKLETQQKIDEKSCYNLAEQLRRSVLILQPQWQKKNILMNVLLDDSVYFIGNEELMQQVWINILGNSIKFTPQGGEVTIDLTQNSTGLQVQISDTGIGMDPETTKRLFDKFFQGDKSHVVEGNGLGLSLAKRIVDLSGGSIRVESSQSKGSIFYIQLPLDNKQ